MRKVLYISLRQLPPRLVRVLLVIVIFLYFVIPLAFSYGKTLWSARKVRMEFKYDPSTCSKTCAGPVFWYLPDDEP